MDSLGGTEGVYIYMCDTGYAAQTKKARSTKREPTIQLHENEMLLFSVIVVFLWSLHRRTLPTDIVVAKDGSGDFKTNTETIQAVPSHGNRPFYIRAKSGLYNEYLMFGKEKTSVTMFGDGMAMTVISGNRHARTSNHTSDIATIAILGDGFIARDMAFQNVAGHQNNQAVILKSEAKTCAFFRSASQVFKTHIMLKKVYNFFEYLIYRTIDFIIRDAAAIFQNCFIYSLRPLSKQLNTITANARALPKKNTGIILLNCSVTSALDLRQPDVLGKAMEDFFEGCHYANFFGQHN